MQTKLQKREAILKDQIRANDKSILMLQADIDSEIVLKENAIEQVKKALVAVSESDQALNDSKKPLESVNGSIFDKEQSTSRMHQMNLLTLATQVVSERIPYDSVVSIRKTQKANEKVGAVEDENQKINAPVESKEDIDESSQMVTNKHMVNNGEDMLLVPSNNELVSMKNCKNENGEGKSGVENYSKYEKQLCDYSINTSVILQEELKTQRQLEAKVKVIDHYKKLSNIKTRKLLSYRDGVMQARKRRRFKN